MPDHDQRLSEPRLAESPRVLPVQEASGATGWILVLLTGVLLTSGLVAAALASFVL